MKNPAFMSPTTWRKIRESFASWQERNPEASAVNRREALREIFMSALTPTDVRLHLFAVVADLLGVEDERDLFTEVWRDLETGRLEEVPVPMLLLDLNRRLNKLEMNDDD